MVDMTRNPLLLFAVGAVLALGACGSADGDKDSGGAAGTGQDHAYEGALKFAKCMREHGIDMPDPTKTADGGILQKSGGPAKGGGKGPEKGLGPDNPKMKSALADCEKYQDEGGGEAPSPAEQAKLQDAFLAYSKCMRGKGINLPDPKFDGGKVTMALKRGSGPNPESPAFKAADKACHPVLAAFEPKGDEQSVNP
jgi:hypothetical protein